MEQADGRESSAMPTCRANHVRKCVSDAKMPATHQNNETDNVNASLVTLFMSIISEKSKSSTELICHVEE